MKINNFNWVLRTLFILVVTLLIFLFSFNLVIAVTPSGANLTYINSTTAPEDSPTSIPAQAGNVTEMNIFGYSTTQAWQGYFGNVTGTIQLGDYLDNVMYNWSDISPRGEVYTSTNSSINWNYIMCLNFSSDGTYSDDSLQNGSTSLYGTNLSQIESAFNINSSDADGINETFNLIGAGTHTNFYTNNLQFSEGECQNSRIFSNAGYGEAGKFEEVLLYEPQTKSVIFVSLLNSDLLGFDNRLHDFEMLVLEDGHGTDRQTAPYYFYVELQ